MSRKFVKKPANGGLKFAENLWLFIKYKSNIKTHRQPVIFTTHINDK